MCTFTLALVGPFESQQGALLLLLCVNLYHGSLPNNVQKVSKVLTCTCNIGDGNAKWNMQTGAQLLLAKADVKQSIGYEKSPAFRG